MKQKFINLNKLFNCNKKISKNSYFRFPYIKEGTMYCIPQVIYTEGKINFIYDEEKIYMNIENILQLISDRKLFINKNNNQHIFNKAYFGQEHKNKYINICDCHKNICEKCKNEKYICHQELFSKKSIPDNLNYLLYCLTKLSYNSFNIIFCYKNQIKNILKELENENYNEEIKKIYTCKFKLLYDKFEGYIHYYIYLLINKSSIKEMLEYQKDNLVEKCNYNIIENLNYCNEYLQKVKLNKKRKNRRKECEKDISKINYIIPFHRDKNNNFKDNIYIGVSQKGFVIIIYFNFFETKNRNLIGNTDININNNINYNIIYPIDLGNNSSFKIINSKYLNGKAPFIIKRLEKCFEEYISFKDKQMNLFLVCFSGEDKAKILGISDDYKEIEILKDIKDYKGLINAIEIKINNNYYLLSCTNEFKLWYYDSNTKEIENKIIIPKKEVKDIIDNNFEFERLKTYKPLIFIEKRKLLIAQVISPEQYILFYNINDDNNAFNIIFLTQIKINKVNDPHLSDNYFNSYLIKDKYLLIGTKIKLEKKIENQKESKNKINNDNKNNNRNNNKINNNNNIKNNNNNNNNNNSKNINNKKNNNNNNKNKIKKNNNNNNNKINNNKNKINKINNNNNNNNKIFIQIHKVNNNIIDDRKIKNAGMYLINLDMIFNDLSRIDDAIQMYYIDFCQEINCISQLRENMFICSLQLIPEKKVDYSLITFNIEESNEGPIIKKISHKCGIFKNIISSKAINDSFIICSSQRDNQILKIDEDGKIYNCFNMVLNTKY